MSSDVKRFGRIAGQQKKRDVTPTTGNLIGSHAVANSFPAQPKNQLPELRIARTQRFENRIAFRPDWHHPDATTVMMEMSKRETVHCGSGPRHLIIHVTGSCIAIVRDLNREIMTEYERNCCFKIGSLFHRRIVPAMTRFVLGGWAFKLVGHGADAELILDWQKRIAY